MPRNWQEAGFHGGFGDTLGARKSRIGIVTADSSLVGDGHGRALSDAAKRVEKDPGYTDVAVHGSPDSISVFRRIGDQEQEIKLDQRRLANFLKSDAGYAGGNIRLLSCKTGTKTGTFAQNLANKMGVIVRAPSDTLYIWPNGKIVIGPDAFTNSGKWVDYYPNKKRGK